MTDILTTSDLAAALGVTERRVRQLAIARGLGRQVSRGTWIFAPADLAALRSPRKAGRPRKEL